MKILHLFDFYLPNTMNWAHQKLRNTPGVQQWVAAPWMVRNAYFDADFRFFVRDLQQNSGLLFQDEWKAAWLSTNLIRLERLWPLYKNWLFQQLKDDPPDVLHAHFGPVGCVYLDLARKLSIPLVVSFYGYDFLRVPFERPVYWSRYQQLFLDAAAVTTTGPFTRQLLEAQGCPPEKITPVPLGIALDQFPWTARKKSPGRLQMVQVATITGKKGHLDTLEALRLALPDCPELYLTLAGEQQDKALVKKMRAFIRNHRLEQNVQWIPALPHQDLPDFLGQFDIFIHPSCRTPNSDSEGAPVVIVEAQATGLPVLATTHADIPAQVIHGATGLLSPENAPEALAQNIKRFYFMDDDEYQRFCQAARAHVVQQYDVKTTTIQLKALYEKIKDLKPASPQS